MSSKIWFGCILLILTSFCLCISCGTDSAPSDEQEAEREQLNTASVSIDSQAIALPADTLTGSIQEVVDDGKDDTKEPCNEQIRSQIGSQEETIRELKEILEGETDTDILADISAEIQQSEKDLDALRTRHDCE